MVSATSLTLFILASLLTTSVVDAECADECPTRNPSQCAEPVACGSCQWQGAEVSMCVCTLADEGTSCASFDLCKENPTCSAAGLCVGANVTCSAKGLCERADGCYPSIGCVYSSLHGPPCSDPTRCGKGMTCQAGQCIGGVECDECQECDASGACVDTAACGDTNKETSLGALLAENAMIVGIVGVSSLVAVAAGVVLARRQSASSRPRDKAPSVYIKSMGL